MIGFTVKEMLKELPFPFVEINFFTEYDGKSDVDGHFGVLSECLKGEIASNISNVDILISLYSQKSRKKLLR